MNEQMRVPCPISLEAIIVSESTYILRLFSELVEHGNTQY